MDEAVEEPAPEFPGQLDQVPAADRLRQTFGVPFIGLGAACLLLLSVGIGAEIISRQDPTPRKPGSGATNQEIAAWCAGLALGGIGFIGFDIYRRRKRAVLAVRLDQTAIYRKGARDVVVPTEAIRPFRLNSNNSFREVFFGFMVFIFPLFICFSAKDWPQRFALLAASGVGATWMGSSIWTRLMCLHFYLPTTGSTDQYAVFPKSHPSTLILADVHSARLKAKSDRFRQERLKRKKAEGEGPK